MDLLERRALLDEMARHLREAQARAGKIAFVCGEAGAGKSALVELFAQQAASAARVLWGHCDALQNSRVLGPVHEVVAGLSLLPDSPREPGVSRDRLFSRLLERLSPPNPLSLVVLEDLHWADEATLDFVRFLGRRIQRTRCLLLATLRDDELDATHLLRGVLGELTGEHTARIRVPPLSFAAVEQLARETKRDARQVYQVTGGNAFFVREMLAAPMHSVPETVRDAVLARLMQCSAAARDLAELVSLLPCKTEPWLTRALLGDVGAAQDEAVARGLLRYHGESLEFRHELGRLAIESAIPRARAQAMHQRILRSLVEHQADLSQLVHHAGCAQDVAALLEYAPRAAQRAARAGAHRDAVAHLNIALRHLDSLNAQERAGLLEQHAIECNVTNQVTAALASCTQALVLRREQGDIAAQARMLVLIARQYWKSGKTALADQHVADAIAQLETLPPGLDLAMAYSARAQLAMTGKRLEETLEFGKRALDLAARFGDYGVQTHALNNIGTALLASGAQGGLETLEKSLVLALEHDLQEHAGRAYVNLVISLARQRSLDLAGRYLQEGLEYCEVHDVQDCLTLMRAYGAWWDLYRGQWDRAAQTATQVLATNEALSITDRLHSLAAVALVRARRGDPGVDSLLDEAARLAAPTNELKRIGPVAAARAEVAWYRGDRQRAAEEALNGLRAAGGHSDTWIQGELIYWAHRAGASYDTTVEIPEPFALMMSGAWQAAAAAWQQIGAPYEQALALAEGDEPALRESLAIAEQLGAGPLAAIVRRRLRELGARRIPRGPRASTRKNPAGLTAREVAVLNLLVQGHTNVELARRLHLSTKTIDHHVSSILEKLEVRSRTEAVAAAFGRGIVKSA